MSGGRKRRSKMALYDVHCERSRAQILRASIDRVMVYATEVVTGERRDRMLDDLGCCRDVLDGDIAHLDERLLEMVEAEPWLRNASVYGRTLDLPRSKP